MNKLLCCIAMAACSGFSTAHAADDRPEIDITRFTCEAFMQELQNGQAQDMRNLAIWLDGYLTSITGEKSLNWKSLQQFFDDLVEYCRAHSKSDLFEAAHNSGN